MLFDPTKPNLPNLRSGRFLVLTAQCDIYILLDNTRRVIKSFELKMMQ